jgi:hypothetical protein
LEEPYDLPVREAQVLVEVNRQCLCLGTQQAACGSHCVGGLQRVSALHPASAAAAVADLEVEPTADRPARNLLLKLLFELQELDATPATRIGANGRKRDPVGLVHLRRRRAVRLSAVFLAGLASALVGVRLGLSLGEWSGLTFRQLLEGLDDLPQFLDLSAKVSHLALERRSFWDELAGVLLGPFDVITQSVFYSQIDLLAHL